MESVIEGIWEAVKFGFVQPLKDMRALKLSAFLGVFLVVMSLISTAAVYVMFKPYVDSPSSMAALTSDLWAGMAFLAYFFVMIIALTIVQAIIVNLIDVMAISRALEMKSFIPKMEAGLMGALKLLVVGICVSLFSFFSVFNLKMLLILAASVFFTIVGFILVIFFQSNIALVFIGVLVMLLGFMLFGAYLVVVIYNSIRLVMSPIILVEKDLGIIDSCRASWVKTEGQVLGLFIAMVILSIILTILVSIVSIPVKAYSVVLTLANPGITDFAISTDPLYILLAIPIYLASGYAVIVGSFFLTSIYATISGKSRASPVVEKNASKRSFSSKKKK